MLAIREFFPLITRLFFFFFPLLLFNITSEERKSNNVVRGVARNFSRYSPSLAIGNGMETVKRKDRLKIKSVTPAGYEETELARMS